MKTFLSRLSGWQRLWVVLAIISLFLTTIFVVITQRELTTIEDEAIIAKVNAEYDRIIVMSRAGDQPDHGLGKAMPTEQQKAALKDLQRRRANLSPEKVAALDELSRRWGISEQKQPTTPSDWIEVPLSVSELYHEHEFEELSETSSEQSAEAHKSDDTKLLRLRARAKATLERTRQSEQKETEDSFIPDSRQAYPSDTKVDTIDFPNDMRLGEIKDLIYKWYGKNPDTVRVLAATLIRERNVRQVEQARNDNSEIRSANTQLALYGYLGWLVFVASLYVLGCGIGWIYRGFRQR